MASFHFKMSDEYDSNALVKNYINKMIEEILPNTEISSETRELLMGYSAEFIRQVATEANEISKQQMKNNINSEHVLMALDNMGFKDYRADAEEVLKCCKAVATNIKSMVDSSKLQNHGIPVQVVVHQKEHFAKPQKKQSASKLEQRQGLPAAQVSLQQRHGSWDKSEDNCN